MLKDSNGYMERVTKLKLVSNLRTYRESNKHPFIKSYKLLILLNYRLSKSLNYYETVSLIPYL